MKLDTKKSFIAYLCPELIFWIAKKLEGFDPFKFFGLYTEIILTYK
ncbi:hypothetical protein [Psychrobacillus sp. BL-248-WT-3]|nr:hypothetical protein [Psychrobacillus sp. BL-248-WT-3]NME04728.1 hypothetical protein [Psychrobacillus sp. BL-248-WT-3]